MMKPIFLFAYCLTAVICISGCQSNSSESTKPATEVVAQVTTPTAPSHQLRDTFDCKLHGTTDPTTHHWDPSLELFYTMATDASSKNKDQTPHFNVFQIYNTLNCHLISNNIMGYNGGVVRPIRIHTDLHEPVNQIVCAQGTDITMCYHTGRKETLPPMQVKYPHHIKHTRVPESAPKDLALWKQFLFASVEGIGTMAYDIRERKGTRLTASAIYSHDNYKDRLSLYIIPDGNGFQAIIPTFDGKNTTVHEMFSEPMNIQSKVIKDSRSGRFMITRPNNGGSSMIIDMKALKAFAPPKAGMSIPEILEYLGTKFE